MESIEAVLHCYGSKALKQTIEIKIKHTVYTNWMIEGIKARENLLKIYTKKQIIEIYESGI